MRRVTRFVRQRLGPQWHFSYHRTFRDDPYRTLILSWSLPLLRVRLHCVSRMYFTDIVEKPRALRKSVQISHRTARLVGEVAQMKQRSD